MAKPIKGKKTTLGSDKMDSTVTRPAIGWAWLIVPVVAGQLLISFGHGILGDSHLVIGVLAASLGSLCILYFARRDIEKYWDDREILKRWQNHLIALLALLVLAVTSWLNYSTIRIGYAEDEMLEFALNGMRVYQEGWIWWSNFCEVLDSNLVGLFCRLFPIRFETIKLVAFIFRTGAGIFVWLLATELFGKRVGLWVGLIVATSVMYMCSFNTVIKDISSHAVFLASLYFTFLGLRKSSGILLLVAGMTAGVAYYSYVSFYAFITVYLCWAVTAGFMHEKTYTLTRRRPKLALWLLGFLILMSPAIANFIRYPCFASHCQMLAAHATNESAWHVGGISLIIKDALYEFMGITYQGAKWFTNNFEYRPMLWWPWACFFWVGLAIIMRRWRESRVYVPLLLMAGLMGLASLNCVHTPNWKISRTAMLLSAVPAGVGVDFVAFALARRFGFAQIRWAPLILVLFSLGYGWTNLGQVMTHPASWWFQAANTIAPREDFVYANPQYRFWEFGCAITDVRPESKVSSVCSIRQVLETPSDGRDVVFLFPAGRQEWTPKIKQFLGLWQSIYPGGDLQVHSVPVTGGQWPTFISYRVPSSLYWYLPLVPSSLNVNARADLWWQRVQLLQKHGLTLEAWRDALQAGRLVPRYYDLADKLLGNEKGREGRLAVLIHGRLWDEARTELACLSRNSTLSPTEESLKTFLDAHGLEMEVYSTYTPTDPPKEILRQYMPDMYLGNNAFASSIHLQQYIFNARVRGRIFVPRDGHYRFTVSGSCGEGKRIEVDGNIVLEISAINNRQHAGDPSKPVYLQRGLHEFMAENCTFFRFKGTPPITASTPDVLSYLYGLSGVWLLQWQCENEPLSLIPPECLYAPDASETSVLPPL